MFNMFNQALFLSISEVIDCLGYDTVYRFIADRLCLTKDEINEFLEDNICRLAGTMVTLNEILIEYLSKKKKKIKLKVDNN